VQRNGNLYTLLFAAIVCIICSFCLAISYQLLRPLQIKNVELDKQKNILIAARIVTRTEIPKMSSDQIGQMFRDNFEGSVIDLQGNVLKDFFPKDINLKKEKQKLIVYKGKLPEADESIYVIPIFGKGLWSTMYGYFALEQDLNTVKGITFYQHGETPGLGAEVEREWFTQNFVGKKILDDEGNLVSIKILKGKVSDAPVVVQNHSVDGISGATLTCDGVSDFLLTTLKKYEPYFKKVLTRNM